MIRINDMDARKAATAKPMPVYPLIARQLKIAGRCEVEVVVGLDGSVEKTSILNGNPVLTKAAVEALRNWRFTPFQSGGEPARATAILAFDFRP